MQKLSRMIVDHSKLKSLLKAPEIIPLTISLNNSSFTDFYKLGANATSQDQAWIYYKCITHDQKQLKSLPRNLFTSLCGYIEETVSTLPTCMEKYETFMTDLYIAGHLIQLEEMESIINTIQKVNVEPLDFLSILNEWPIADWQLGGYSTRRMVIMQFMTLMVAKYGETGNSLGIETILQHCLKNGYLESSSRKNETQGSDKSGKDSDSSLEKLECNESNNPLVVQALCEALVDASISKMFEGNNPICYKVLSTLILNHIDLSFKSQKSVSLILDSVTDPKLAQKIVLMLIHSFVKSDNRNSDLASYLFKQCQRFKLFKEADLLWLHSSQIKKWKQRITRVFIPLETTILYCELLMEQQREIEAVEWFWKHLARLPNKIRCDLDLHQQFLQKCSSYQCLQAFEMHDSAIKDVNIHVKI